MKRASTLVLVVAAVLLAGCDRAPASPVATSTASTPTAASPAVPTPAVTLPPTSSPTAPVGLVPTRGVARPAGQYLVERDHALWLVSPTGATADRRVSLASGSTWEYLGMVTRGPAVGPYVMETVGFTNTVVRLDGEGVVHPIAPSDAAGGAVSPDGRFLAYAANDGLRLRDLPTGADRLLGRNVRWRVDDCAIVTSCVNFAWASWSDSGRFAVGTGTSYEPVVTWLFDIISGSLGSRVPGCSMGVWYADRLLVEDGNCYSDSGFNVFWYDPVTGQRTDVSPPTGRECRAGNAAVGPNGVLALTWYSCLPAGLTTEERYARRSAARDLLVIYDAVRRVIAEREHGGDYRPALWSADGAGVIVEQGRDGVFRFVDLEGEVWTLEMDAVSVLDVLPTP